MSEFGERHTVARLVGAPPGYVGYDDAGQLTEAVRRRPYRVVCFDEIDKAHPEAFGMLLQILEEGQLTDARGRMVDFRNTIIIMTSNVGADALRKGPLGNARARTNVRVPRGWVRDRAEEALSPRVPEPHRSDHCLYHALRLDETGEIVDLELDKIQERLDDQGISLEATPEAKVHLADKGYSEEFGARNLRRAVQQAIEDELSEGILSGEFAEGDHVIVDVQEGEIVLQSSHEEIEPPLLEAMVNV